MSVLGVSFATRTTFFHLILIPKYSSVVVQKLEENLYIITGSKDTAWAALQYFYRMNDHGEITTRQLEMVYGEFYE
jgi:hypothetical protein